MLLRLSWYCEAPPESRLLEDGSVVEEWTFKWDPPDGTSLHPQELVLGPARAVSFEVLCSEFEKEFGRRQHGLLCKCCALEAVEQKFNSCLHCVGFHKCLKDRREQWRWRKSSLHGSHLDAERAIYNLHRKRLPLDVLREKTQEYVTAKLLPKRKADRLMRVIEQERQCIRSVNEVGSDEDSVEEREDISRRLSMADMKKELEKREALMQVGGDLATDQWRVYTHITNSIRLGEPLRLMVQASAGTGP